MFIPLTQTVDLQLEEGGSRVRALAYDEDGRRYLVAGYGVTEGKPWWVGEDEIHSHYARTSSS